MASDICFLNEKKERGGGGKGRRQAPSGGLAGRPRRGPGVGLHCPVLFNPLTSWVRRWGERDSWGTGRVSGLPGGSFLPTCLRANRGSGCDWSAQLKGPSIWDKALVQSRHLECKRCIWSRLWFFQWSCMDVGVGL